MKSDVKANSVTGNKRIIPILLGVFLLANLVGNVILYSNLASSKQMISDVQNQLDKTTAELNTTKDTLLSAQKKNSL